MCGRGLPVDGADDQSAYDLAVAGGYFGTVGDWIASLEGEKGEPGGTRPRTCWASQQSLT